MTCFMKRLLLQICLAWTVSGCLSAAEPAEWKAAAAKAVITPTEPMYLAGFANREVPAEGTAMELHAKSLAVEDKQGARFVMVTLDLVEVTYQLRDAVAAAVKAKFGLPERALLLNCSHTHCGPELRYTELEFMSFTDPLRKGALPALQRVFDGQDRGHHRRGLAASGTGDGELWPCALRLRDESSAEERQADGRSLLEQPESRGRGGSRCAGAHGQHGGGQAERDCLRLRLPQHVDEHQAVAWRLRRAMRNR
jgi:hypothetical protein